MPKRDGGRQRSLRLPAQVDAVPAAQEFIREAALWIGATEVQAKELDLVMEELVVNIARYAYPGGSGGDFEVTYELVPGPRVAVRLEDWGVGFDPTAAPAPNLGAALDDCAIGGLGIVLVRALVRGLFYRRDGDRNLLGFEFPGA